MRRIKRNVFHRWPESPFRLTLVLVAFVSLMAAHAAAARGSNDLPLGWDELPFDEDELQRANPVLVLDGTYVMNAGNLHMNITNYSFIGSLWPWGYRFSASPSAQWPAGSGHEYMFGAGLWVGGSVLGTVSVSTAIRPFAEIMALGQGYPEDTIYEAIGTKLVRPPGNIDASGRRFPDPDPNDDGDFDPDFPWVQLIDEETLDGYDNDGDGLIDEDFAQIGNQMMVLTMYDNTPLSMEWHPDHRPLNIKVVQESYAWENPMVQDFVGFEYTITNIGVTDISDMYVGMMTRSGVASRDVGGSGIFDDMAGSFSGPVRASDGSWMKIEMGFFWDAAEENRIEGYFGVVLLGHTTDLKEERAPSHVKMHTFQHFSSMAPFQQGGLPTNDDERYEAMSNPVWDQDVREDNEDNFDMLITAGPFPELSPDEEITFQIAFVAGHGLEGLKRNAAEALLTFYGSRFDVIEPQQGVAGGMIPIGVRGRETMLCVGRDFSSETELRRVYPDFGDLSCLPSQDWLDNTFQTAQEEDIFLYQVDLRYPVFSRCVMVNMDNCFECYQKKDHTTIPGECTEQDFDTYWDCYADDPDPLGCTGLGRRETQVTWIVGMAPPPPGMRVWPTDRQVHIFWDNRSEITPDVRLNVIDFQSYRIWRADNWTRPYGTDISTGPGSQLWQLIAEYDVVDSFLTVHELSPTQFDSVWLPLGRNTGLDRIRYRPRILDDPRFVGLAEACSVVAYRDPTGIFNAQLPPLFTGPGVPNPIAEPLLRWQGYPDALDTFWAVTARPESSYVDDQTGEEIRILAKDPIWYCEYIDSSVHNGFLYFYSVTATDHELERNPNPPPEFLIIGPGLAGDPSGSFQHILPARSAQTAEQRTRDGANIFVYPNPATRSALREFQQLFPSHDDPTGVRVNFANLPEAQNTISIFTISGDLVQVIEHDGSHGYGEASWNLISRNGQEVVSGIYLYSVQSSASGFDDFIGKFVVVR